MWESNQDTLIRDDVEHFKLFRSKKGSPRMFDDKLEDVVYNIEYTPAISIVEAEEAICGSKQRFKVDIKPAKTPGWSDNWQRNKTAALDAKNKYKSSNSKQLAIKCASKEDEGKYEAFFAQESNENIYKILSNEPPCFDVWVITTERGITIRYKVLECSSQLHKITWMKNGEILDFKNKKYVGGSLKDGFITITSPTIADRGTYSCTVTNDVGSVSERVKLDLPESVILTASKVFLGSKTVFKPLISSIPSPCGVEWQKSINGQNFSCINLNDPKFEGSSTNPISPLLVITNTTFEDVLYYRLRVWNKIGETFSNTLRITVITRPPSVLAYHKSDNENRSIRSMGEVSTIDQNPPIHTVFWCKNGDKIDTKAGGRINAKLSKTNPSLTIHNVNLEDSGSYRLTAVSYAGPTEGGHTTHFNAAVKQAEPLEWSDEWQKNRNGATELIEKESLKCKGSHSKQLGLHSLCKEVEKNSQALLLDLPCFNVWNISTERGITINYNVLLECFPRLYKIEWMKNGETLVMRNNKYVGGGLNDGFITINSPTKADRGTYSCTVTSAVGSVSKNITLDIPSAKIETDSKIVFGTKTIIKTFISSCPPICGMQWQKSTDRHNFSSINVGDPKHEGSSIDPKLPLLVITRTTFADMLYYRLRVWNQIGQHFSNALHLDVTGKPPTVSTLHTNCIETRSVELIGNVFVIDQYPIVHTVYWTKNGEKIDPKTRGRKYSKVSVKSPSLTIYNVNHHDAGSYRLTATNAVGSDKSDIVLGVPEICIERREKSDGSQCFTAKIKSIPEAYHVQWKVKRNGHEDFSLVDVNCPEYKGTSNSLHRPVLVVKKKVLLESQCFHIKVDNFIGSSIKEIFGTPIQYFFYKPDQDFNHFHYVYNLIRNCKSRVENIHLIKEQKNNLMPKDVFIKIGIAGKFHEDNLHLISGETWKETISEDQQIWESSPLLCFQNDLPLKSVLEIAGKVSARHRIIITPDGTCKEAEKTADSIIIVGKNKQQIKKIITICLEEPFDQIFKKWLKNLRNPALTKVASEIIAEIKEIRKHLDFEKSKLTTGISGLQGGGIEFIVPDNVKVFLLRMPYVNSFGIWGNSSFKVFVQKETDENKIKKELLNINKDFFDNFHLEIVKGKFVQKKTLKQGDPLLSCKQNDFRLYNSGTLGGFVRKNDDKRKIYALTCNHIFPEEKQLAYAKDSNGFREMGTCVFTTREKACDFAAIELKDSFLDVCDVTVRRDDNKKVNAKLYTKNLRNVGLVHKIGAATNVTSGRIISLEYYDKEMDSHCRENIFLVKGLNGPFSKEGDSGSLVFSRPNSVIQNSVNVLGMVYAQNFTIDYDDDDCDDPHRISAVYNVAENVSVCYRIHTALELFKKSQGEGFDVKFQDDLSVTLSSSLQSLRSEDLIDILK